MANLIIETIRGEIVAMDWAKGQNVQVTVRDDAGVEWNFVTPTFKPSWMGKTVRRTLEIEDA